MSAPESGVPRTLWTDDAGGRFYLVPDGVALGSGPLRLRSGAMRFADADPAAVAPYEVSREEGRAFLDARLDAFLGGARARVESWVDGLTRPSPHDAREPAGESAEAASPSPEALLRGLGKLFEDVGQAVAQAGTGEEGRQAALARLRALGEQLRAHGISAPPADDPGTPNG